MQRKKDDQIYQQKKEELKNIAEQLKQEKK